MHTVTRAVNDLGMFYYISHQLGTTINSLLIAIVPKPDPATVL